MRITQVMFASCALSACASSPSASEVDASDVAFAVSGGIHGAGAPPQGTAFVVWEVETATEDYLFKFGDGGASATEFTVALGSDPPPRAINPHGIAVGYLALAPAGSIPDGELELPDSVVGISAGHAIVWRGTGVETPPAWAAGFEPGYSCGLCSNPTHEPKDSFLPVACSTVVIQMGTSDPCNWK